MKPRIIRPTSHEEWLRSRKEGIGASEVGAIIGVSPFDSPFSIWLKKTGQVEPEPENEAMLMGHLLEDAVAKRWEIETGQKVIKASAADIIYVHPKYPHMRVTPDRIAKGRKKLLECKTTVMPVDENNLPPHWVAQVTYQMYVTGIHDSDIAWLESGRHFGYANVPYDEEFAEFIACKVQEFWYENVLGGKEPDAINVEDLAVKVPKSTPEKSVTADESALDQIAVLREKKAMYEALGDEITDLQNSLKMFMEDSEALLDADGTVLLTWKSGKDKTSFDSKRFAEENPDLYDKYCKTVPGARSFLLKKPKAQ